MALPEIKVRVSAETGSLDAGLSAATTSLNKFSRTSQQVAGQLNGMTNSTNAAAGATSNIAYQFQDIAMMLQAGQSPFTLAMQQGTQLAGILNTMKNPIQALGAAFLQIINPVSLVTIGTIALGAAAFQAFTKTSEATKLASLTIDEHLKRIQALASGYKDAQDAAKAMADEALRLPQAVVTANLGAEQAKQLDLYKGKLEEVANVHDRFIEFSKNYSESDINEEFKRQVQSLGDMSKEAQNASPNLDKMLTVLNDLALNASDEAIRTAAKEMYEAANAALELRGAALATGAAMSAMASNALAMSKAFGGSIQQLSSLYMDQRSTYEQARSAAEDAYKSTQKVAQSEMERYLAAQEYKRVLDSINESEAAAEAARTKTGGGGNTKDADAAKAELLAKNVEQLKTALEGEIAVESAAYAAKMQLLADYYDGKEELQGERRQYEEMAEKEHQEKLDAIRNAALYRNLDATASIFGSISNIMKAQGDKQIAVQKGIASAGVAISTAAGIMKAIEQFGWPGGLLPAAAVAAQGAAQLASINSASASGANSAGVKGGSASATEPAMNRTLTVQGITAGQIFSGDSMRDFMEQMLQMQRDGYQVVLA